MVSKLLPWLPLWKGYCEPFVGGASVLLARPPAMIESINDADETLVQFFRILRDPVLFPQFLFRVQAVPYARTEYNWCRDTWDTVEDPVERVARWFVAVRLSFGGKVQSAWGFTKASTAQGMAQTTARWISTLAQLPLVHDRLQRVQIDCGSWDAVVHRFDTPETLFFLDPPYVPTTVREQSAPYMAGMTTEDHMHLVDWLLHDLQGGAVLCGYPNALYTPLEDAGWHTETWQTVAHIVGHTQANQILGAGSSTEQQPRVEKIWVHPRIWEWKCQQSPRSLFELTAT